MKALTTIALLLGLALVAPAAARAGSPCGDAVVSDWADGRIDGRYAPRCYGDALASLPEDIRAYSTAEADIAQAMRQRIRETRRSTPARGPGPGAGMAAVPIPLVSAGAIALLLALAGLAAFMAARLRRERLPHRRTRPIGQW